MQESRQLCLLINWSWCFICFLLMLIPRWFISCGQSLNAFRVHAFVMSSASGSVPLVPYLSCKRGLFRSPSSCLQISALRSSGRAWAPWHRWPALRESQGERHFDNLEGVLGKNSPCAKARAVSTIDRSQALEPLSPGFKSHF